MDSFLSDDEKEQNYKLQEAFHKVFETPEGKIVFNALLNDLHYFDICKTEGDVALRNYATFLINQRLGVKDTLYVTNHFVLCNDYVHDYFDKNKQ